MCMICRHDIYLVIRDALTVRRSVKPFLYVTFAKQYCIKVTDICQPLKAVFVKTA